ncbi:FAD:protein FMN transferase [Paenibacillus silvisoli]|uniref:FAD:protein FMN transferase n=1 Tax=Paenibacillus silvisoli TaxID=3110539 RepID=UPI0028055D04|nr:FAD:protein FMN transferase [Paenibacillus silvisoli]
MDDNAVTFQFKAMNTTVACTLSCSSEAEAELLEGEAQSWFDYVEDRFSRFVPDSELSRLNRHAGSSFLVSAAMLEVLQLSDLYRELTDGTFDPFVREALLRSGYSRSFEELAAGAAASHAGEALNRTPRLPFKLDAAMRSVLLPAGSSLDLGGIVKSWAVKRLADWFRTKRQTAFGLINAGGDLTAWGAPEAAPWRIGIEHPWESRSELGRIWLTAGASATSSTLGRLWQTNAGTMHHLIDPATMAPSSSDIVQCTTAGSDPVACEIWAKTLCILGSEAGLSLLSRRAAPVEALLFSRDRRLIFYGSPSSIHSTWRNVPIDQLVEPSVPYRRKEGERLD